jgi:hypothetical protein
MIRRIEALGDRLLATVVPRVTAAAEPCDCVGQAGQERRQWCKCTETPGSWVWNWYNYFKCDGCRWYLSRPCQQEVLNLTCGPF